MGRLNIPGNLKLIQTDEKILSYVTKFLDDNPQVEQFMRVGELQFDDGFVTWYRSVIPNEYGLYLSTRMKDSEGRNWHLDVKDIKHASLGGEGESGEYSKRKLLIDIDVGSFVYQCGRIGFLGGVGMPKELVLDHKSEHVCLPKRIDNTIPGLEKIVDRKKDYHIQERADWIENQLGKNVRSYIYDNKESWGFEKLA